jgi:hypothetical protein
MRVVFLSTILALGLGLAVTKSSQAASFGAGVNEAAKTNMLVDTIQYRRCRAVRVCRDGVRATLPRRARLRPPLVVSLSLI